VQERVRVWAVDLTAGVSTKDHPGFLSLDAATLRFEPSKEGEPTLTIALVEITRVRRLRGSPVLMVLSGRDPTTRRTAFYFVQPPPLTAFEAGRDDRNVLTALRNPRRKARRENVGYLGLSNRAKKDEVVAWEKALRSAVEAARSD
jgi:hypothetical protein